VSAREEESVAASACAARSGDGARATTASARVAQGVLEEQFFVRTLLDDAAAIQDEEPVGPLHGAKAVGDDQRRAALHQVAERLLDELFALGVEAAGRLVQDQDAGRLEHDPGDRQPLPLPARQPHPPLADQGLVAVGQALDELVGVRPPSRLLDLLGAGVRPAVGDVLEDGAGEERGLLRHEADCSPQVGQGDLPDVPPAPGDEAARRVPEAEEKGGDGGLAASARPHEGHHLARPKPRAHGLKRPGLLGSIPEPHILELDLRNCRRGDRHRLRWIGDLRLLFHEVEHPDGGSLGLLV
jgi:hypothetical protein